MLIAGFPAGFFQANCYVLAPGPGGDCVVVDPGEGAVDRLTATLAEHRLRPAAVLLTHGHLDHVGSAAVVCDRLGGGIPAYLHPADDYMLDDPLAALGPVLRAALEPAIRAGLALDDLRPRTVQSLTPGEVLRLAGLSIEVDHAPGHTGGGVIFRLATEVEMADARADVLADVLVGGTGRDVDVDPDVAVDPDVDVDVDPDAVVRGHGAVQDAERGATPGRPEVLFTGDTLFAGSIGRADLPGGDHEQLLVSIKSALLTRPDSAVILPGHGPTSTIGGERAHNPFLR